MDLEPDETPHGAPEWMVTFADLMSLLLTFFVLLLSFSTTEVIKFREAMGSIREALGMRSEVSLSDLPAGEKLMPYQDPKAGDRTPTPQELESKLEELIKAVGLEEQGEARVTPRGVVLRLDGDLLFESGKAEINLAALNLLDGLAAYVSSIEQSVDVIGHTDNVPISTPVYPSNWELSAARAGHAVRYLVERGVEPNRLRAIGQAETEPVAENEDSEGRALNRRVELVFSTVAENVETKDLEALENQGEQNEKD